jgi:hypothetical protein
MWPICFSRFIAVWALAFYLILSLTFFGRWINWSSFYFGYTTDSLLFVWFLHWWPFAITHGLNPFICRYVWFPAGYNVTWATSVPVLAILMWPVTALGGPVLSYNILAVTAPALAAWTAFLLIRDITRDWAASLLCGFLFGFCTPELLQLGQLNLSSVLLIPLILLLCLRRLQDRVKRKTFIILLSTSLALQLGISTEVLASLCLMGGLTWAVFAVFGSASERWSLFRLAIDIILCAPLTACITAPFLYYLVIGLADVPQIHPVWMQLMEALYLFVPVVPVHSGSAVLVSVSKQLRGFAPDYFTYVSAPVLAILSIHFCRHMGKPNIRALLILIVATALLSLGPELFVNGRLTGLKLPWIIFTHIPILCSLIPVRFLLYLSLAAAITVALWLTEPMSLTARLPRFALAGLGCIFLRPADVQILKSQWQTHPMFQDQTALYWSRWPDHPFFTAAHIQTVLGNMPNVLLLPDPDAGPGTAWQLDAGLSFTQSNGYIGFRPKSEQKWSNLDGFLLGGEPISDFGRIFASFCSAHQINYILIGPGAPTATVSAIDALGWKHYIDTGIEVVTIPRIILN